jgi:cytochrome c oxidase subunit 3
LSVELMRPAPAPGGPGAPPPAAPPPGEGPGADGQGLLADTARLGLLAFLGTVSMLFLGFTSAYVLRRAAADFRPTAAPGVIWANTAVLALSSLSLELARRRLRGWDPAGARRFLLLTGGLGLLFLAGQIQAALALRAAGVFLATNPHASFVYMLAAVHAAHLLGGLGWYGALQRRAARLAITPGEDGLGLFAVYWHFLGVLWLYLVVLLFVL